MLRLCLSLSFNRYVKNGYLATVPNMLGATQATVNHDGWSVSGFGLSLPFRAQQSSIVMSTITPKTP